MVVVILAHAALIPAGQWQGDEYYTLSEFRQGGLGFLRERLLGWSPRPVSELLVYLYGQAVEGWRRPLVTPVLAGCWGLLAIGTLAGLPPRGPAASWRGLIGLGVLALLLLFHPVGEMFFWPMGALAYLPSLAGLVCAALILVRGLAGRQALCALALLLAAGSAEVGAMFVLVFCGLIGLAEVITPWPAGGRARLRHAGGMAWWAVPLLAAAAVLALLAQGRGAGAAELAPGLTARLLWPSLAHGLRDAVAELGTDTAPWPGTWAWLAVAGAGFACCLSRAGVRPAPAAPLLAFAGAALLAIWLTAASAWFQFGTLCCQRHAGFRGGLAVLAVLALAGLAVRGGARFWPRVPAATGPTLLAMAVLAGGVARLPALVADYRVMPERIAVRWQNVDAGYRPQPTMVLCMTSHPQVVNDGNLPVQGRFAAGPGVPWFVAGVLRFFDKRQVDIIPPTMACRS